MKALTKDSKSLQDLKEVQPTKTFYDMCKTRDLTEYFCKLHMKDRLLNYCHQDNLVDVIFSGLKSLKFFSIDTNHSDTLCKRCNDLAEYGVNRYD